MLKVNNLNFSYSKNNEDTLKDISFELDNNKIYVILGLNGCGKTTLLRLLNGFYKPKSGEILINDVNLNKYSIKERSKLFSLVAQTLYIDYLNMTVGNYLELSFINKTKFYENNAKKYLQNIKDMLIKFNIENLLNKQVNELSGGQKQLIEICATLLQDTPIIYFDEPTSALDLKNAENVLSLIKQTSKDKTIILTSHNPNHALYLNCEVILMGKGSIIEIGHAKDIITLEKLKPIYGDKIKYSDLLEYKEISF